MMMSSSSNSSSSSGSSNTRRTYAHMKSGNKQSRKALSREKRIALQQDVEKLRKKLRLEENIHRAMERAFNRPLGTLPRLPPFLPPSILELLAEVAVLEEEIVRLEEQVVHCRQEFYQQAAFTSCSPASVNLLSASSESRKGKENQLIANSSKTRTPMMKSLVGHTQLNKSLEAQKLPESPTRRKKYAEPRSYGGENRKPNRLSEDLVKCLSNIFMRMSQVKRRAVTESQERSNKDPYGVCLSFGRRDIGPYKNYPDVEAASVNRNRTFLSFIRQLKDLLRRLCLVNLQKLNQQEKLAFWINIYNSCMMNGFLEHGIPESPEMMVTLMQKATINVGGHLLDAITIEHFILRLPYHSKSIYPKGSKKNEIAAKDKFGLEFSEPLVTFALSCGSWSSPAVRVYSAGNVEEELELAKREYLEASVGISVSKIGIPKLMDWYSHDFAKDIESLLDWICLQLPSELGKDALSCLQQGMFRSPSTLLHIIPFDFTFRYIFSI